MSEPIYDFRHIIVHDAAFFTGCPRGTRMLAACDYVIAQPDNSFPDGIDVRVKTYAQQIKDELEA